MPLAPFGCLPCPVSLPRAAPCLASLRFTPFPADLQLLWGRGVSARCVNLSQTLTRVHCPWLEHTSVILLLGMTNWTSLNRGLVSAAAYSMGRCYALDTWL